MWVRSKVKVYRNICVGSGVFYSGVKFICILMDKSVNFFFVLGFFYKVVVYYKNDIMLNWLFFVDLLVFYFLSEKYIL